MAKMNVDKSIRINKAPADVFSKLNDFNHWRAWSPWLIMEPEVKVTVADDRKSYAWEGDLTGSGNMTILSEKENESLEIDLQFIKPWKSRAKVGFTIRHEAEGSRVRWTLDNSLPFFMFWMKKQMQAFIGMDYSRGLEMLKDYCEDGVIHSRLNFKGDSSFEGCKYVGIMTSCSLDEMKESMSADFQKLMGFMADKQELGAGAPFSIYHNWDMVKQKCSYTACMPVNQIPESLPEDLVSGEVPKTKIYTVHHHGSYRHIGNAWSSLYSRQQAKKFKLNKAVDPMEVYLNSPKDTAENELETEIHFPVQ